MHSNLQRVRYMPAVSALAIFTLAIAANLAPGAAQADSEVYRWVDAQGNMTFSDTPPSSGASKIVVKTSPTRPLSEAATPPPATNAQPAAPSSEQIKATRQQAATMKKMRTENCERARGNLQILETSRKIYDPLPDGERHYLDDSEVAARKVEAQADIQRWCAA